MNVNLKPKLDEALATLAKSVESFAGEHAIGDETSFRLNVALDELLTNCITYSLPKVTDPLLRICLEYSQNEVMAQVEDNGPAFDPLSEAPQADTASDLDDRAVGGLGVFLVTQFADTVYYERDNGLNRITLKMKLEK